MPAPSPSALRKVTLNLLDADVEEMSRLHGHGWSQIVRELVHTYLRKMRKLEEESLGQ